MSTVICLIFKNTRSKNKPLTIHRYLWYNLSKEQKLINLKDELQKAIKEERYEDAGVINKEIKFKFNGGYVPPKPATMLLISGRLFGIF